MGLSLILLILALSVPRLCSAGAQRSPKLGHSCYVFWLDTQRFFFFIRSRRLLVACGGVPNSGAVISVAPGQAVNRGSQCNKTGRRFVGSRTCRSFGSITLIATFTHPFSTTAQLWKPAIWTKQPVPCPARPVPHPQRSEAPHLPQLSWTEDAQPAEHRAVPAPHRQHGAVLQGES